MSAHFDTIIVGGGTAGCIVAARLTEDAARNVLLVEAGPDYSGNDVPEPVLDGRYVPMRGHADASVIDPRHDWGLAAIAQQDARISVPQARLIGGGSAINGMISLRGATADYRDWAAQGNPDWTWEQVLQAYRDLEDDPAGDPDVHGTGGPFPLVRAEQAEYGPLQAAFVDSCRAIGIKDCADFNAPDAEGVGPVPMNRVGSTRMSTALTHLEPARERDNLTVLGDVLVQTVEFDGLVATGIRLADGTVITAGEVILSAGAIQTPALLQRSGVGPADLISEHDVPLVVDLPVGHHLADHFAVPLMAVPIPGAWKREDFSLQTAARISTSVHPGALDGQLTMFSYLNVGNTGEGQRGLGGESAEGVTHVAGIGCVLNKPVATGTVAITSLNPAALPAVRPNYLGESVDRDAIREIVRLGWRVLSTAPLSELIETPMGLDQDTIDDDVALDSAIEHMTASGYHFTGTCKMAPRERGGVVDQRGMVHGVKGLRIVDASVIPVNPAGNSMLPTVMTAERLASFAREAGSR